jgi:hypothetical protein
LTKARDQLEREGAGSRSIVRFYSRSPFGALHRAAEGARDYPDYATFSADAPQTLITELNALARHWDRSVEVAFALVRRIEFTVTGDYDEIDRDSLAALRMVFARPEDVRDLLEERLRSHQTRLRDPVVVFRRADLANVLAERGHVPSPHRTEAEQLAAFARSSRIGRSWVRDVGGTRLERSEIRAIVDVVESGAGTVLVLGEPGIGKTCVLLDVADALEQDPSKALLFIKGDRFSGARTMAELVERGLPDDLVGRCARLAVQRPVVVVMDALDVLSLQRAGGTLELFLGLLDQLATIENVTVIAACRTFDLQFDPLLRGRSWGARVTVGLLEVERHVVPILGRWGVDPDRLDRGLVELLRVPGRLWLYGQLLGDGPLEQVGSLYELHDRFLEGVEREPGWGAGAVEVLDRVAARMQATRSLEVARTEMPALDVLQGLLSRGVLVATERGYAFGHQELMDVVAVRSARRRGERLADFVAARPGLPFLRPTVRVFCHVLRAQQPTQFRREVRAFISDERIAYHLRRLVAETLAETQPEAEDVPLLRWLMVSHGDLFERFLQRASAEQWLPLLVDEMLLSARRAEDAERWTGRLLRHLAVWAASRPEIVLPIWRRAIEEAWPGASGLNWAIAKALEASLPVAGREQIPWTDAEFLVRHLVQGLSAERDESYVVGPVVQAWVEAGGADDVVIDFLDLEGTIDRPEGLLGRRVRGLRRRGEGSAMQTEFLAARMAVSDPLIDAVLAYVLREAGSEARRFLGILNETSWRARHNRGMMSHDVLNDILTALEGALGERAARDDAWWRLHAPALVAHDNSGIRYLAVQALRRAPEANRDTISGLLTDVETWGYGELDSEISELANAVYPFLSAEDSARHQAVVLSLSEPRTTDTKEWMVRLRRQKAYEHLLLVPHPYRVPEANEFIQRRESEFGPYRAQPRIYMSGGFVAPPVSAAQIQGLSDQGVLRVIGFWGTTLDERDYTVELVGGWDQLVGSVRDAAMNVPGRALGWLDALLRTDGLTPYLNACVEGIAAHLCVRFGRLNPSGTWQPAEPLPDGQALARTLLGLLEQFDESWITEHTLSDAVEACTHVLDDDDCAARLTALLTRLGRSPNPDGTLGHNPGMEALNSTRGKAALAAVNLATNLAKAEREVPEALVELLLQLARDPRPSVQWAALSSLPPLTYSHPELAWRLLEIATEDAGSEVWEVAQASLYHNYHRHFDRVGPILERIRESAFAAAGGVYGRIGALSWLSGHLDDRTLYGGLSDAPASVWSGGGGGSRRERG